MGLIDRSSSLKRPAHHLPLKLLQPENGTQSVNSEHLFYHGAVESPEARLTDVEYLEIQCKSALNSVKGMGFKWSLNPYIGCEHRCAFCYVRAYELRADRPFDDRYGRTVRIKVNVAGGSARWRHASAATRPESSPADRKMATGTSETRCAATDTTP